MKKVVLALGLLAVVVLPGCNMPGGCKDCRSEVNVQTYGKGVATQTVEDHSDLAETDFEFSEEDDYEL